MTCWYPAISLSSPQILILTTFITRFDKKVNLRKFDKYVTEVQVNADEVHGERQAE